MSPSTSTTSGTPSAAWLRACDTWPGGRAQPPAATDVVVPLRYRADAGELNFLSITAVVGTPMEVTVSELAIEGFYPADAPTAAALG